MGSMKFRAKYFTAMLAALSCAVGGAKAESGETFRAEMNPRDEIGGRIYLGAAPFVRGDRFTVHSPLWTERYVRNIEHPRHVREEFRKTADGVFRSVSDTIDQVARLKEYSIKVNGASALITAEAEMRKKLPAQIEHVIGLDCWVLENADYEVVTRDGRTLRGRIPEAEPENDKTLLIPEFIRGAFRSRRGITTVEVLEGPAMRLNDRRGYNPMIWGKSFLLWSADAEFAEGAEKFRQVVRISFAPLKSAAPRVSLSIPGDYLEVIRCPAVAAPEFPLVPRPRNCRFTGDDYAARPGDKLMIGGGSPRLLRHAAKFAAGWGLEVARDSGKAERGIRVIYGGDSDDESYTIRVGRNGATVRAKGERGAFYALQTLRGLEKQRVFRGAEIDDAPAFAKRAIHAMGDSDTKNFMGGMIEKVLAPLKINTIILECPYVNWEATKGKHRRKGMPKEDLPEFLKIAEENYIKVYPLIPTYSHSEWFFWNGKDTELRENPQDPRSYNSLDPRVYEKLTALFDEVLEAFGNPEYFHISHDELHDHPTRPEGKKIGVAELFYRDLMWHHDFFRKRGVKLMMWHDMIVSRAENHNRAVANARGGSEKLRAKMPKDITVCMWDYYATNDGNYYQIDALQRDGFPVWGATWFFPRNLELFTAYAHKKRVAGMIETTWHNKVGSGGLLQTQYVQLKAYIRAAALFWNPEYRPLPDPARTYVDLMCPAAIPERRVRVIPVKCNTILDSADDAFDRLPETLRTRDGMAFKLAKKDGQTGALMVKSTEMPDLPGKVRIPIKDSCRRMYLLHTTLSKASRPDRVTVKLVFRYKDGGVAVVYPRNSIDISYGTPPVFKDGGKEVARVSEVATPRANYTFFMNHRNVFEWKNAQGDVRRIWYLTWDNPEPGRELDHLLVETVPNGSGYALLALSMEK